MSEPANIPPPAPDATAPAIFDTSALDRLLGGDLPCVVCKYNLRGISIRSVCPECGTAVRATILAVVDPHAAELEPLAHPRVAAAGLLLWIGGALLAVALCWLPPFPGRFFALWHVLVTGGAVASALGALTLIRPHEGVRTAGIVAAAIGAALYVPLVYLVWYVSSSRWNAGYPPIHAPLWFGERLARVPTFERIGVCVCITLICLLVRPNARLFVARCLALRTGRVDRQALLAVVAAAAIAMVGEGALMWSRSLVGARGDTMRLIGQILIPAGWALVTVGLVGSLVDAARIARTIVSPSPALGDVLGPEDADLP